MPYLVIIDKEGKGDDVRTLIPSDRPLTIGRGAGSLLRIRDSKMSRVHCELTVTDGVTTIKDLDSKNGTLVNDECMPTSELKHGDVILAGYTCFRYLADETEEEDTPEEPEPDQAKPRFADDDEVTPPRMSATKAAMSPREAAKARLNAQAPKQKTKKKPPPFPQETKRPGSARKNASASSSRTRAEKAPAAKRRAPADIVALFGITCDVPDGAPGKGELLCASCRRPVPLKDIKAGKGTDINSQICCAECVTSDPLIGKTVAGYRVDAKLGAGAWSTTYKAEQLSMARNVVFRSIGPELLADPELSTQFLAAVKRGGQISHPNLVRMYDIGRTAKRCYASVEYIDGPNIARVMRKKAGFRGGEAAQIIADIASAVDIAHRRNVLHFDIRPSNILLNEERIPKLAGLGFSKVIEDAVVAESLSIQHAADTVAYWAPERLTNPKRAGKRADVYSLGAVLYAMLAGRPPFDEHDPATLVTMICDARPTAISSLRKDVPHRLNAIVAKAMAKNPTDRYAGCQFLARDLRQIENAQL